MHKPSKNPKSRLKNFPHILPRAECGPVQTGEHNRYVLEKRKECLQLINQDKPKFSAVGVNFVSGASEFRRKYGGGRKQAIAKAVGLKKGAKPVIVDATAGLGRDAFVLASLGCRVHMIERSPVVAALLEDGLKRAKLDPEIGPWVSKRMSLLLRDSRKALLDLPFKPDVVYIDPMYPERQKSALVKKEMRVFQSLVGDDADADDLLEIALNTAQKRVVVKRPNYAGSLAEKTPNTSIKLRSNRFDIYLTKSR